MYYFIKSKLSPFLYFIRGKLSWLISGDVYWMEDFKIKMEMVNFPMVILKVKLCTWEIFCLFRVASIACEGSQARSRIGAVAAGLHHKEQQRQFWAMSTTYTTAHGNAGYLTHWARPGIEPASSWILVRFFSNGPLWENL